MNFLKVACPNQMGAFPVDALTVYGAGDLGGRDVTFRLPWWQTLLPHFG